MAEPKPQPPQPGAPASELSKDLSTKDSSTEDLSAKDPSAPGRRSLEGPTHDPSGAARRDVLDSLSDEFLHNYGKGRTLLAVDGLVGAGARTFADALARRAGRGGHAVFRASMVDFHRSRAERAARAEDSARGFYRDAFDYDLFRRVLIEPFKMGGSTGFVTAAFDAQRDTQIEMDWKTGPRDATLIIDGLFLNRAELRGLWNFSIWIEATDLLPEGEALERISVDPARVEEATMTYLNEASPRTRAGAIVDNSNPATPLRIFADSC